MNKELNEQKDPNFLLSTTDAKEWADEYCRKFPQADHGTMLSWFACAIMTGFDEANRRKEAERTTSPVSQMTDATIREIFMAHGFTVKEGQTDLKPYVYAAARALLAAGAPHAQAPAAPVAEQRVDDIVTALYRRFKDWSKRGFGPDDVTWCEVKADVMALIAASQHAAEPVANEKVRELVARIKGETLSIAMRDNLFEQLIVALDAAPVIQQPPEGQK